MELNFYPPFLPQMLMALSKSNRHLRCQLISWRLTPELLFVSPDSPSYQDLVIILENSLISFSVATQNLGLSIYSPSYLKDPALHHLLSIPPSLQEWKRHPSTFFCVLAAILWTELQLHVLTSQYLAVFKLSVFESSCMSTLSYFHFILSACFLTVSPHPSHTPLLSLPWGLVIQYRMYLLI